VENRPDSPNQKDSRPIVLHISPSILVELQQRSYDLSYFSLTESADAQNAFIKNGERLWVSFSDGGHCDFPYYLNTVQYLLSDLKSGRRREELDSFASLVKTGQSIEKKLFSSVPLLWDEVIKKINSISNHSHSLGQLVEELLKVPFLQNFQTSLLILHLKGQTKASMMGLLWRSDKHESLIEVKDFNAFYTSVKKSKIKSFATDSFPAVNLPFNGSFLAKEFSSKKYSMLAIVSRDDFLSYSQDEIELYETCIELLQPHIERLVDQEFSDKRVSELRVCLKDFPLPLRIIDTVAGATFTNDLFTNELQDKDIFFSKRVSGPFELDLYDSDELRHYAFDLFHFQRISLLGELLNTLRHELSNPLFGLKLGAQIFNTFDVSADSKEFMSEIEKNVNRCQVIIENFSTLYQIQSETKPVTLKKIVEEAMVLAKSEGREVRKTVTYKNDCDRLELNVPLIFVVQIIFNLIVNGVQAIAQAGTPGDLQLTIHDDSSQVYIDVQDSGTGIAADKACQLFKPFFTTKNQGTGLGLVLSRNLALKMSGNLEYLDNNGQKGALFRLTLPKT
jgi:two-component system, NtrC family, sensor kinase